MLSKKIYVLFLLILIVCSFSFFTINAKHKPLSNKIIFLDPGHGGLDPGSTYKNIYEKDINLKICFELKKQLEKKGAKVFMTRYGDYDLSSNNVRARKRSDLTNRAKIINKSDADMYISIHLNATQSSTWKGIQVFYDDVNQENKNIAKQFQKELNSYLKTNRTYSEIKGMLFNRQVKVPGILIEVGFLSNPNDRYLLRQDSYHKRFSIAATKSLINYYNG